MSLRPFSLRHIWRVNHPRRQGHRASGYQSRGFFYWIFVVCLSLITHNPLPLPLEFQARLPTLKYTYWTDLFAPHLEPTFLHRNKIRRPFLSFSVRLALNMSCLDVWRTSSRRVLTWNETPDVESVRLNFTACAKKIRRSPENLPRNNSSVHWRRRESNTRSPGQDMDPEFGFVVIASRRYVWNKYPFSKPIMSSTSKKCISVILWGCLSGNLHAVLLVY